MLLTCIGTVLGKKEKPCVICSVQGPTTVTAGSTQTYQLSAACSGSATSWTVSCGTVQGPTSSHVNIYFSSLGCTSPVITAWQGSTALATLTVTETQPLNGGSIINSSQSINYNAIPALLNGTAATGGSCGTSYTYQWYTSADNINFTTISGATGVSYQPGALTVTTYFKRVVTCSGSTASTTATVTVYPQLVSGTVSPSSQSINYNTSPSGLTTTASTGGNGTYTYQWYSSPDGTSWTLITGATNSSYAPGPLTATTYYRYIVASNGATATSNTATVTVYPQLQAGTLNPATQTIDYGSYTTIILRGYSGGNGTYTSQWQSSPDSSFSSPTNEFAGYNLFDTTLFAGPLNKRYYRVAVTSNGATSYSTIAVINVNPQLFGGVITPASITLAATNTTPGILSALPASGGACSGSYSYQWQSGTDSTHFSDISGATLLYYDPGNISVKTFYRRKVTCGTQIAYTNSCRVLINGTAPDVNYIRQRIIMAPGITDTATANALSSPTDVHQSTTYVDGLGRPLEDVQKQASPLQKDVVSIHVYDFFGRESSQYLPYTSSSGDGNFKINPMGEQSSFNVSQYPGEHYYYGQKVFESSGVNSPQATFAPGQNWLGSTRGDSIQYLFNTLNDSVQNWTINSAVGSLPVRVAACASGTLYKTVVTDQSAHQVMEYKNPMGMTILKKTQLSNNPGSGHAGWLCTYYVYDTLQHLRFIIQPKAVDSINGSWSVTQTMANELCFRYEFDGKGRPIVKKSPGAGEIDMVYDSRDRLVMTQDSNMRALKKWMVAKYDNQNRMDSSGLLSDSNNRAYHQNLAYNTTGYPSTASNFELLNATYYDDYTWVGGSGTTLAATMATNITSNSNYFITSFGVSPAYAAAMTPNYQTRGLATGARIKVVGTSNQYLYEVCFYDDHRRVIQKHSTNQTGATDTATMQYGFNGNLLRTLIGHKKAGNTVQNHIVSTKLDYDASLRLRHIWKNIDNATGDQLIDSLQYNELGQLKAKYLGNGLDSLVFDYNLRGWLTGINKNYLAGTATHYFGVELAYDKTVSAIGTTSYSRALYDGNIAGTVWKSAGDGVGRKYEYTYDNSNRLTAAGFMQNTVGSTWDSSYINFSISNIRYDANGNILGLNRSGFKVGGSSLIDQLNYSYQYNRLLQVTDAVNDANSKLGDFHYNPATKAAVDYRYDGNGSILADNNKNIDTIAYNYLGLPQLIHMKGEGNIQYTYDASGSKLMKLTVDSVSRHTTTTLYVAGFVYQQTDTITSPGGGVDTLQFVGHEEGRIRWALHRRVNGTLVYGWEYDFFEKDQLGNTRILLTQQKDTSQYLATMEAAYRNTESKLFYNLTNTGYARNMVSGYPVDTTITNPNDSLARVNGNGNKVGPGIILKVMSGDKVDIGVQSYYNNITDTAGPSPSINDVLASLATGIVSMTGGTHGGLTELNNTTTSPVYAAINSFQGANNPAPSGKPKAYLNWILLDDQFKYVSSYPQSGAVPVGTANQVNALGYTGIPITKSGYLYVYVSNETPGWDAFFDNLSVKQYSGPMLEETHYYPFGLTMAAISDKAMKPNYTENKFRYNGGNELQNKEFNDGSGLELYDAQHRMLDPQLGRFGQIDPIADAYHSVSPYSFANDNPVSMLDPDGLRAGPNGTVIGPGGPTPSPNDLWLFSSFSSSSDLWNDMERSQQETDAQIQGEFAEAQKEADAAYQNQVLSNTINQLYNAASGDTYALSALGLSIVNTKYNYTNDRGSYVTGDYHGLTSHQDGEDYLFTGTSVTLRSNHNTESGESGESGIDLEKSATATGMAIDFHNAAVTATKILAEDTKAALKGLSRTGTVAGAIVGGGFSLYNLAKSWSKGEIGSWTDWAGVGLAGLGLASEFIGIGEVADGVIATSSIGLDIYNAAKLK
ncbi:DUF6443 domain-containing protein [Flavitalea sp. BT771]|uniref:DUF6443 domain-containing protein n=1 Tax=Flavitalea sp. BT771 TaxID=3063329 RepID=UPI0026E2A254|nr:DUF6443 domain-containing protein [Flavitalea sp. BT771]MDO6430193.1 DUF6443 domain-containing protein [Flavitalea sp. BT771]MDV6219668.1 DUF6443 domain-containing protein [Flavitalea sp. BT771]